MTEKQAKAKLVKWCKSQIGKHEGENNWNAYAENKDLQKWYGWKPQNQPWCDIFADSAFLMCFGLDKAAMMTYQPIGSGTALCSASANCYKAADAWKQSPAVGDQVFFDYGNGINHTGIVIAVSGGVVTTIEGNSSDTVRQNAYAVGSSCIAGYGRPKWAVVTGQSAGDLVVDEPKPEKFCSVTVKLPVIRFGDKSGYVKVMQNLLMENGYTCGWMGADGEYGQNTEKALFKYQTAHKLKADTVCGAETWTSLLGVK